MSLSLVQEWDYGARKRTQSEKSRDIPYEIGPFPVLAVVCRDIDSIHGGFAWSFVREGGPRCLDRRAVIEGSFQGVRLETLKSSSLLPKVKGFPFVFFLSIFASPLPAVSFSLHTYIGVHIYVYTYIHTYESSLYGREDIRILATYLS